MECVSYNQMFSKWSSSKAKWSPTDILTIWGNSDTGGPPEFYLDLMYLGINSTQWNWVAMQFTLWSYFFFVLQTLIEVLLCSRNRAWQWASKDGKKRTWFLPPWNSSFVGFKFDNKHNIFNREYEKMKQDAMENNNTNKNFGLEESGRPLWDIQDCWWCFERGLVAHIFKREQWRWRTWNGRTWCTGDSDRLMWLNLWWTRHMTE